MRYEILKNFNSKFMGNRIIADLRYGENDIISPSTLTFAPIKG